MVFLLSNELVISCASCNRAEYFLGYLTKLLENHTAYACDGQHLSLHCPRHSTISVQSAFYGQDPHICTAWEPETRMTEPRNCVAPTSLQVRHVVKVLKVQNGLPAASVQVFSALNETTLYQWQNTTKSVSAGGVCLDSRVLL